MVNSPHNLVTPSLDTRTQLFLEEIVRLTAQGLEPPRIARDLDLDLNAVTGLMALPQFNEIFELLDPEKHKTWTSVRMAQLANQRVRTLARNDAVDHYTMLRELVRSTVDMRDETRASILERLIKMSGLLDQEVEEEVVHLAPNQIANINQAYADVTEVA